VSTELSSGATGAVAATALADALADAAPAFVSAAACRLDGGGPDVTDVFGGRIKVLLRDPDRTDPRQWGRDLARALLARAPHLAQLPGPVLADVVGTLADVVRADVAEARGDRASLAGAIGDLDRTLHGLRPGREIPVDVLTDLLTPGRSELADALDEAADSPLGLSIEVTLADGKAQVRRDPDRAGGLVVELFGGAGGWAEGLLSLGIHDVGLEWDPIACKTRVKNGHATVRTDVSKYPTADFAHAQPWGLIASPPCQPYSAAGLRLGLGDLKILIAAITEVLDGADPADMTDRWADIRAGLVLEIVRWARDLRPDFVACEETPGAKPVFAAIAGALQALGYRTVTFVVNAADFGLGQTRKRVILLAHRRRQPRIPDPTHSQDGSGTTRRWRSMADVVGFGLTDRPAPTLCARNAGGGPRYEGGSGARASIRNAQAAGRWKVRHNPDGSIDPADAKAARGETGVSVYGRMTPSEAGVLQGFRPDYQWQGTTSRQVSCVGNAVPPPLARAMVAELIGARHLITA
jgi:DNA (cytosine-5)-methyltransferase 1